MMACHAVVQRILLEGLGIVEVDPRTAPVAPVLQPPTDLDMKPMFADDGISGFRRLTRDSRNRRLTRDSRIPSPFFRKHIPEKS